MNKNIPKLRFPQFINNSKWSKKSFGDFYNIKYANVLGKMRFNILIGDLFFVEKSYMIKDFLSIIKIDRFKDRELLKEYHQVLARPKSKALSGKFAIYLFKSPYVKKQVINSCGGTVVFHLEPKDLQKIAIYSPEHIEEQEKISNCLSSIDEIIKYKQQRLEHLQDHKGALIQMLFPSE